VTSAIYGLLIALIFTLPPLERARTQPAAAIFRSLVDSRRTFDRRTALLGRVGACGADPSRAWHER
jgi:putative ABC transport system permease protein